MFYYFLRFLYFNVLHFLRHEMLFRQLLWNLPQHELLGHQHNHYILNVHNYQKQLTHLPHEKRNLKLCYLVLLHEHNPHLRKYYSLQHETLLQQHKFHLLLHENSFHLLLKNDHQQKLSSHLHQYQYQQQKKQTHLLQYDSPK